MRAARKPVMCIKREGQQLPVAIVDIGSNSVRLVVYESQSRVAATLQNEKSICAIGRDMVTTGRLHAEGCTAALEALSRFRMIADGLNAEHHDAVATAPIAADVVADDLLGVSLRIGVGGIDEVPATLQKPGDDGFRFGHRRAPAPFLSEGHRSQTKRADA